MKNDQFIDELITYKLVDPIYKLLIKHIIKPLVDDEDILNIFTIYFTYNCSGSSCMPLNKELLKSNWKKQLQECSKTFNEDNIVMDDFDLLLSSGYESIDKIDNLKQYNSIIGDDKLFIIYNDYLYSRKYYEAKQGISKSIHRLFIGNIFSHSFNYDIKKIWNNAATNQIKFVYEGLDKNLILNGPPGTGKTTAVFYLLLVLLKENINYKIYLTAPSGKASDRIKESINDEISSFKNTLNNDFDEQIKILENATSSTIHNLLQIDYKTNSFVYNENKQFDENSIFIIDEASMIDICLFDSLLKAIANKSRVFILGDKDQLPSVECGAVLSDLLQYSKLNDNIVYLNESFRFKQGSQIYNLSKQINEGEVLKDDPFVSSDNFTLMPYKKNYYPVSYYYLKDDNSFKNILKIWAENFYFDYQEKCSNLQFNIESLENALKNIDEARILCSENNGKLGVNTINKEIKNYVINSSNTYHPGVLVMITENNKSLDLFNGDTGIIVKFKNSDILYLLIEKQSKLYTIDSTNIADKVLKLSNYLLYPLRLINLSSLTYAYAITIHKSQGSGYKNIMVILPNKEGHPLLNKQIIYTGITRTKGTTYIISNIDRLNEAIKNESIRYTNIFK